MPLDHLYPETVVFIIGRRKAPDGETRSVPIGTGFVVSKPNEADPSERFVYAITARHCVEYEAESWVRFRSGSGRVTDVSIPKWTLHPTADVALARLTDVSTLAITHLQLHDAIDTTDIHPGDRVYFMGLLAYIPAMAEANIPMVRSGTIGAMYQDNVPIRGPDKVKRYVQAHLIDCRSFGGFSGSPCFVQYDKAGYLDRRMDTGERVAVSSGRSNSGR